MTNPYFSLINYEQDEWSDYLDKLCLINIFKPIIDEYGNNKITLNGTIRYILMAYSVESESITIGMEWVKNKQEIFNKTLLDKSKYDDLVLLKNKAVLITIKRWLDFQDNEQFSTWSMLKDLIVEMRIAANSDIKKATGEIDYETKKKCADYVIELYDRVKEVEAKFIQSHPKLKEGYKEFNQAAHREKIRSLRVEDYV